jgi:NodT family efflux transporter outer membrane factor (OMF) lipoprotein
VALARLVALREVAVRTQGTRNEVQRLVRQRIGAGLDTNVELRQSEGLIAQTLVDTEQIDESIERARHALAELTGQGPQAYATLSPVLGGVSSLRLPGGLPADLIGRRPDLVAARWRVEAATQDVKAARAQFYPNVNLAAFVGLSSLGLDNFFKLDSRSFGAGPAVRLPIFDAGRLRAGLKQRTGDVDVAVDSYNSALLRAVREVADEVSTLRSIERQQASQADALTAAESSYSLATDRYRAGLGTLLTVLSAEGSVLTQRRATTDLKARHLNAEVALIKALGGGFKEDDIAATSPIASSSSPAVAVTAAPMARSLVAAAPHSNKSTSLEVSP